MHNRLAKPPMSRSFEQALLEAINEALSPLGEDVKTSIYFQFEQVFRIKKQCIPQRLGYFSGSLERIFGSSTQLLEMLVTKSIPAKIGGTCEWAAPTWIVPDFTFQEHMHTMRTNFEDASTDGNEIEVVMNADN